jgi:hypothetical protein
MLDYFMNRDKHPDLRGGATTSNWGYAASVFGRGFSSRSGYWRRVKELSASGSGLRFVVWAAPLKSFRSVICPSGRALARSKPQGIFAGCVSRNISLQNPAGPFLADYHAITCDNLAPGDRHHRPSGNLEALPRSVVGAMMQILLSDRLATMRIPQRDIGVEADADRPLSGVETVYLGVIGRTGEAPYCATQWAARAVWVGASLRQRRAASISASVAP